MAWCQRCGCEYEGNVRTCEECGDTLVEHALVCLVNVANSMEADRLIAGLEAEEIPAFKRYESSGEYLQIATGINFQGVDIYVPAELLETAKGHIADMIEPTTQSKGISDREIEALEDSFVNKRTKIIIFMIVIALGLPIMFFLVSRLIGLN